MRQTTAEIERPAPRIERLRSRTAAVGHPTFLSRPIAQDVLLAGLLTATSLVGVLVHLHVDLPEGAEEATVRSLDALGLLLILLQTVPLTWRRRAPIPVLAVTMSALFAYSVIGYFTSFAALGFLVALYTAAAYRERSVSIPAGVVAVCVVILVYLMQKEPVEPDAIYACDVDIFAPYALGGVINDDTLDQLTVRVVAGAANNILLEERHGDELERPSAVGRLDHVEPGPGQDRAHQRHDVLVEDVLLLVGQVLEAGESVIERVLAPEVDPELGEPRLECVAARELAQHDHGGAKQPELAHEAGGRRDAAEREHEQQHRERRERVAEVQPGEISQLLARDVPGYHTGQNKAALRRILIVIVFSSTMTFSMRSRTTLARSAGERLSAAANRLARSSIFRVWSLGMPAVPKRSSSTLPSAAITDGSSALYTAR